MRSQQTALLNTVFLLLRVERKRKPKEDARRASGCLVTYDQLQEGGSVDTEHMPAASVGREL
jgi:hypothetical protein